MVTANSNQTINRYDGIVRDTNDHLTLNGRHHADNNRTQPRTSPDYEYPKATDNFPHDRINNHMNDDRQ